MFFSLFAKTQFLTGIRIVLYSSIEFCLSAVTFQDTSPKFVLDITSKISLLSPQTSFNLSLFLHALCLKDELN